MPYSVGIKAALDQTFATLEAAASAGARCPSNDAGVKSEYVRLLAHAGKIAVEISTHNWRRVTILTGPRAGKSTAPNPLATSSIYLTIDASGSRRSGRPLDSRKSARRQPSAPRLLPYTGKLPW